MSSKKSQSHPHLSQLKIYDQIEKVSIDKINPNDWNPNFENTRMYERVKDDLKKHGFIDPIIVQKHNERLNKDYVIINGEHRYKAFRDLKQAEAPCVIVDCDDKKAKVLTLRLNIEHGELMPNKIQAILVELSPVGDMKALNEITGIPQNDLKILSEIEVTDFEAPKKKKNEGDEDDSQGVKVDVKRRVKCPKCGEKFKVLY